MRIPTHPGQSVPWTRTISPLSKQTVPEYIQQQIAAGRREQMAQKFPDHPLLRPAAAPVQQWLLLLPDGTAIESINRIFQLMLLLYHFFH